VVFGWVKKICCLLLQTYRKSLDVIKATIKRATRRYSLLATLLKSDVASVTPTATRCKTGNITFHLVLRQCCKTNRTFGRLFYRNFTICYYL